MDRAGADTDNDLGRVVVRTLCAKGAVQSDHVRKREAGIQGEQLYSGVVPCPACEADLRYSIAASNGHIMAVCKTPGCVRFRE